jgi:hypothetical protein
MAEKKGEMKSEVKNEEKNEVKSSTARPAQREVPADLVEAQPENGGLFHWVLASPMLLFLIWLWADIFAHFSPISSYWLDALLATVIFVLIFVLPVGVGAFYLVTSLPRLFSHAGWDLQPLETVREAEQYLVRYRFVNRHRAPNGWGRAWVRAAQGWVYLEIAAILIGAVVMVPVFFSVSDFGFGQS